MQQPISFHSSAEDTAVDYKVATNFVLLDKKKKTKRE